MSDKTKYKCKDCGNEFYETNYSKKYGVDTKPTCPKCGGSSVSHAFISIDTAYKYRYLILILISLNLICWYVNLYILKNPTTPLVFIIIGSIVEVAAIIYLLE